MSKNGELKNLNYQNNMSFKKFLYPESIQCTYIPWD
jgi:hypothetical protein